jgi:hypothetical protein
VLVANCYRDGNLKYPFTKYLKWKSIYHILEKLGEFNISAQNDVDFPTISLKDKYLLIVYENSLLRYS